MPSCVRNEPGHVEREVHLADRPSEARERASPGSRARRSSTMPAPISSSGRPRVRRASSSMRTPTSEQTTTKSRQAEARQRLHGPDPPASASAPRRGRLNGPAPAARAQAGVRHLRVFAWRCGLPAGPGTSGERAGISFCAARAAPRRRARMPRQPQTPSPQELTLLDLTGAVIEVSRDRPRGRRDALASDPLRTRSSLQALRSSGSRARMAAGEALPSCLAPASRALRDIVALPRARRAAWGA